MRAIDRSDYLAHFGIKGMKWGVRRFQNKDGSYTSAGLKRRFGGGGARTGGGSRKSGSGKARSGSGSNAEAQARKAKMKKALMIGAGLAGTAALAYGIKSGKLKGAASALKNSKLGQSVGKGAGAVGNAVRHPKQTLGNARSALKSATNRRNPNSAISRASQRLSSARINAGLAVGRGVDAIKHPKQTASAARKALKSATNRRNPNSAISRASQRLSSARINAGLGVAGVRNKVTGAAGSARKALKSATNRRNPNSAISRASQRLSSARINAGLAVAGARDKVKNSKIANNKVARVAGLGAAGFATGYAGMAGLSAAQKKVWAKQGHTQYSSKGRNSKKRKGR